MEPGVQELLWVLFWSAIYLLVGWLAGELVAAIDGTGQVDLWIVGLWPSLVPLMPVVLLLGIVYAIAIRIAGESPPGTSREEYLKRMLLEMEGGYKSSRTPPDTRFTD